MFVSYLFGVRGVMFLYGTPAHEIPTPRSRLFFSEHRSSSAPPLPSLLISAKPLNRPTALARQHPATAVPKRDRVTMGDVLQIEVPNLNTKFPPSGIANLEIASDSLGSATHYTKLIGENDCVLYGERPEKYYDKTIYEVYTVLPNRLVSVYNTLHASRQVSADVNCLKIKYEAVIKYKNRRQ